MKYRTYGLVVESQEPIDELNAIELREAGALTQISIERVNDMPPLADSAERPPPMPELEWPVIARDRGGYRLSFSEGSAFWVAADGRTIRHFRSTPSTATDRHYLLDHVLPRALDLWGRNPLHATAVATSYGVLAFLGVTGTGKSTMAAALVARGCELMSDDCLVLEHNGGSILALPSYPGLRLYQDVREVLELDTGLQPVADYTLKQRVTGRVPLASESRPLVAIYSLSRHDDPHAIGVRPAEFVPLGPADATMALAGSAFRMDVERRDQHRQQLSFFAQVARSVPIRSCAFGGDLSNVGLLADAVLNDVPTRAS